MSINFDLEDISTPCPKCGKKLTETLGRLKRDKHISCPKCGRFAVDVDALVRQRQTLGKELSELDKQVAKLSKSLNIKLKS